MKEVPSSNWSDIYDRDAEDVWQCQCLPTADKMYAVRISKQSFLRKSAISSQHRFQVHEIIALLSSSSSPICYEKSSTHHCRSAVHGCRLSAIELFLSQLPAPGTTCRATSSPHHICFPKPSEDAPLPAFFPVTFVQCLRSDS